MNKKMPTQIGMREFMRNSKKIKLAVARGEEFEVLDRTTPVFKVVPATAPVKKKYTINDVLQHTFASKQTDLATEVDHYIYGTPKRSDIWYQYMGWYFHSHWLSS